MELSEVIGFFRRFGLLVLAIAFIFGVVAWFGSLKVAPYYHSSLSVFVGRKTEPVSASFYGYDGYYSAAAAGQFTDTVAALFKNDEVVSLAAQESGKPTDPVSLSKLNNGIFVKRVSPQLLTVSYSGESRTDAVGFIDSLVKSVNQEVTRIGEIGDNRLFLMKVGNKPLVTEVRFSPPVVAASAFLLTIFLSVLAVFSLEVYRNGNRRGR